MEWLFHIKYDINFFLAAIPLQLIMIIYCISRRHLPLRESRSFFYLMVLNLLTLVTDIIAYAVLAVSPPHTGAIYFWFLLYLLHTVSLFSASLYIRCSSYSGLRRTMDKGSPVFTGLGTAGSVFYDSLDRIFLSVHTSLSLQERSRVYGHLWLLYLLSGSFYASDSAQME